MADSEIRITMTPEQVLRERNEQYRRLVDNVMDAVGIITRGEWVFMNRAGVKLFGAAREEEIVGKNCDAFLHPDHHDEFHTLIQQILGNRCPMDIFEQRWISLSGEIIHAEVTGFPVPFHNETAIQLVIRDISRRKQAEEMLITSEKLSAIGQLAVGVAHEIRNPLAALKGFVQLLRSMSPQAKADYFNIMENELSRIEMISNEMLMLAKPQAAVFRSGNVEDMLHSVITLMEAQAMMQNVRMVTEIEPVPPISCEGHQIKQVFLNLMKNAVEAMPRGGTLVIRLKQRGNYVVVEFVDEGAGIPKTMLPRLGEPFLTTKQEGTGLGLMVTRKIVEHHHGSLEFSSCPGSGTTVSVCFPAAAAAS